MGKRWGSPGASSSPLKRAGHGAARLAKRRPSPPRRRPRPGAPWPRDEGGLPLHGARPSLGRAGDQDGHGRDRRGQRRRHTHAAPQGFRKLRQGCQEVPGAMITAQLKSSGAAKRERRPGVEPRQPRSLPNRAQTSHQPPRPRETPPALGPHGSPRHGPPRPELARSHGTGGSREVGSRWGALPSCLMSASADQQVTMPVLMRARLGYRRFRRRQGVYLA